MLQRNKPVRQDFVTKSGFIVRRVNEINDLSLISMG
jgi:hypothetical protein